MVHNENCNAYFGEACTCIRSGCNLAGADWWTPSNAPSPSSTLHEAPAVDEGEWRVSFRVYGRGGELNG